MSTSVKIDKEDKEKLDQLQALVTLRARRKTTQQEVLSALIGEAYARGDEFAEKLARDVAPMPDREYEKILSLVEDWGVKTSWTDVDEMLYGSKKRREA